ncbi:MAG: hypothetical protein RBR13_07105 [Tenuifilaceae bacterium]|nr:hypothetical protein [Tenuifilaceae bacterium]
MKVYKVCVPEWVMWFRPVPEALEGTDNRYENPNSQQPTANSQ